METPIVRKVDPVKHEQKRQDILDAAFRCFIKDGFHGASTTDICAAAKISPGHLYHYFPSKEAIVEAMVDIGLARATEEFGKISAAPDFIEALIDYLERGSLRHRTAQVLSLDALAEAARNPQFAGIVKKHASVSRNLLVDFIGMAQRQGQIDPELDPAATANILLAIIDGARAMPIRTPSLDVEQSLAHLRTMLSRFLKPPKEVSVHVRRVTGSRNAALNTNRKR
nr:TetR/AcrR family transcriptional regulator [Bradyrhizobium liaoningense]